MTTPRQSQQIPTELIDSMTEKLQSLFKGFRSHLLENAGKVEFSSKQDGSPVTDIDEEIENSIIAELNKQFPDIPVFGEESGYEELPPYFWLIDPIDGTRSFVEGRPSFTCMAVFVQNDEATASIIYNPTRDEMFVAKKGFGAYKNGDRLELTKEPIPRKIYCKEEHFDVLDSILSPEGVVCEVAPNCAGFGFISVADNSTAARFQINSRGYIHDYATGALIVSEAGGLIIPVNEPSYNFRSRSFIACHPGLGPLLTQNLDRIRELENNN